MIRHPYYVGLSLPAPFVLLVLRNPYTGAEVRDVTAQIDTAADRTLIPFDLVRALALDEIDAIQIVGVGGTVETMNVYDVLLGIGSLPLRPYDGVAHADEPWVLLGRDVLNGRRLLLDGPNLVLEVG